MNEQFLNNMREKYAGVYIFFKICSPLFYIWVKGKKYKKLKIKLPFDFQIFTYIPRAPKRYFLKIHTTAKISENCHLEV